MKINSAREILIGNFTDNTQILNALLAAAWQNQLTVIKYVEHVFYPQGYSAIILLAESHFSIHTFPETNEAVVDCLTCGNKPPAPVIKSLAKILNAKIATKSTNLKNKKTQI